MAKLKLNPFVLHYCCATNRGKLPFSHKALLPFPAGRTEAYSVQTSFGEVGCADPCKHRASLKQHCEPLLCVLVHESLWCMLLDQ